MPEDAGPTWRVLVCAPFPPRLDGRHGGSRALAQLLSRLAARHAIALLVLRSHDEPCVDEDLRRACELVEEVAIPSVGRSFGARIANRLRLRLALLRGMPTWACERTAPGFAHRLEQLLRLWQPDVVQLEYRIMGQFLPLIGPRPCVLSDHDPMSADGVRSPLLQPLEDRAWRSLGRSVSERADAIVVFTDRDRQSIAKLDPAPPVTCIPLGYDVPPTPLDAIGKNPQEIVYVGSYIHPPNIDAAIRLARHIFPEVVRSMPGAALTLVGSYPPVEVLALHGDGVTVQGDVDDVRPYLDTAAVFAAPIRTGGGMRVKVLEALSYGKAIVATPLALEGLGVRDGQEVVVAESDEEFASAIVALLADPDRRAALGRAAHAWAERNLDVETEVRSYEELYASVVARRTSGPARLPY